MLDKIKVTKNCRGYLDSSDRSLLGDESYECATLALSLGVPQHCAFFYRAVPRKQRPNIVLRQLLVEHAHEQLPLCGRENALLKAANIILLTLLLSSTVDKYTQFYCIKLAVDVIVFYISHNRLFIIYHLKY